MNRDNLVGNSMIPEIRLAPVSSNSEGSGETKIGGAPTWIQEPMTMECRCRCPMTFLGQFDTLDIPETRFPDSAMIYVFVCTNCWQTEAVMQCC